MAFFLFAFMLFSVLFSLSIVLRDPPSDAALREPSPSTTTVFQLKQGINPHLQTQFHCQFNSLYLKGLDNDASDSVELLNDKLLGGLLAGFDEKSCLSRTVEELRSGQFTESSACKYVVWISFSGLGNRILTLASAFLYALLTNRVLLVDPGVDMVDLFCEPFPDASWFLPPDFPLKSHFQNFNQKSDQCHGKMLKNKSITNSTMPSFAYLHLVHDYDDHDKLFFCDEEQLFSPEHPGPFQHVLDQILACTLKENLLPDVDRQQNIVRDMYWEYPTVTGEVVGIYQPSHEEYQQTQKQMHNQKAWAEMYLLSLTDMLVTSSWSTFGYVAQGIGGLKPWILYKPENRTAPDPPCKRAMSMEPCFHAPPFMTARLREELTQVNLLFHM
ncbi:Xyloglucan fucosyltransferase [Sesbania bispinosa]|nr:Xyloglucan fucosyltransferase [Sesbania bispinosa]